MKKILQIILITCFSLSIISCVDDEEEYSATGTTAPTVSSISPTKNQSVFLITDNITLLLG